MKSFGLTLILTGAVSLPAMACDICAIYSATRAGGATGQGWFGGVAEQFTRFNTLQEDGHEIPNDGEFINSSVSQVFAGYNFSDRFGLQLNLPVIYRSFGSDTARGNESGIGDISLTGTFLAWEIFKDDYTLDWTLLGGIKFPTGDPNQLGQPDFANGIGGHDLALGSGSYDGIVGTGLYTRWKKLFMTVNAQYALRDEGAFQHQYANDLTWSGGPGVVLGVSTNYSLSLLAVVSGEYKGKDTFAGVPDDDSAETLVALGPQVDFSWSYQLAAQAGVDFPVSIYNSGVQVVPTWRARAALTWRF